VPAYDGNRVTLGGDKSGTTYSPSCLVTVFFPVTDNALLETPHIPFILSLKNADNLLRNIMMPSRAVFLISCLTLFVSPLFCANISVLVIETGLRDGRPAFYTEMTGVWETGIMDVFFEEGHIVTNARAFALEKKPGKELSDEIQSYITEAEDSGIDYFILAYLNYKTAVDTGRFSGRPKPADIEFSLFNINSSHNPSKCVWTQHIDLGSTGYSKGEELSRARKVARSLIAHLGDNI
jgi:hypothetical protein